MNRNKREERVNIITKPHLFKTVSVCCRCGKKESVHVSYIAGGQVKIHNLHMCGTCMVEDLMTGNQWSIQNEVKQ